ncbi:MAG: glycosyltransferase involved in cell wall biosynthesis [Planctomycetota bacterium]|jgi:glycosyltransferase involved in cell wall biosynthesis
MKKSSTGFLTTVFPSCKNYLDDFFKSLTKQTDSDFDVIVINDSLQNFIFFIEKYKELNIIEIKSNESPIQNRIKGLNYIIDNNYSNLIFGDSDDYFSENRVCVTKKILIKNDIVVNDLVLFNKNFEIKNIYKNIKFSKNDLVHSNIFGLSNTAIRTKILKNLTLEPEVEIVAYDWYLFSLLVFNDFSFKISQQAISFYRQYDSNTLGMSFEINEGSLQDLIRIKKMHLLALKKYYQRLNRSKLYTIFDNELKDLLELEISLKVNIKKYDYISFVNKNIDKIFCGWFSQLISLKKYKSLYEN